MLKVILRFFGNIKIRYKLLLSYFLVTVLPVAAIGLFFYQSSASYIKDHGVSIMSSTQQQLIANIDNRLQSYIMLANTIYVNEKLQSFIFGKYLSYSDEYDLARDNIEPMLRAVLQATGKGVYLGLIRYNNDKGEIIQNNFDNVIDKKATVEDFLESGRQFYHIYNFDRKKDHEWFKQARGNTKDYQWLQVGDDDKFNNISLLRELVCFAYPQEESIGMMRLAVRLEDVLGEGPNGDSTDNAINLVLDQSGRVLTGSSDKKKFYYENLEMIKGCLSNKDQAAYEFVNDWIVIKGTVDLAGWKILSFYPMNEFTEKAENMKIISFIVCLAALAVLFVITFFISASFSKRLIRITKGMKKFQKGDFEIRIEDNHEDELGFLATAFNNMIRKVDLLIKDNYQANIIKKEAQLSALQAQINPHFLYNSLSAISRLADLWDRDSINNMVNSLTAFYRMTLNKGQDIISVGGEIEQIKAYIEIYKIRKGEYFNIFYDIEDSVMVYNTVKVILQPFVENVFEHAIYNRTNPINIIISAHISGDDIVFKIIDDGVGMSRKIMENTFLEEKRASMGYGIKNVDDRIKLQYGSNYGVSVFSRLGAGTIVTITIPTGRASA